jgi:ubiquinone/menaquinone biosynthesis C-methylase UbiE
MIKILVRLWHRLHFIPETILGSKFDELEWRYRHIFKRSYEGYISMNSLSLPYRQLLCERISANAPFSKVLELGCAEGPNLYLLARKFPNASFVGVNINPEAIRKGKVFFKQQGISNVSLFVGKADQLQRFPDKSFDIVFTRGMLVYIGRDKIRKVATEIQRVARKAIILVELHSERENDLGRLSGRNWYRNYRKLFQAFSNHIDINEMPGGIGYITEVKLFDEEYEVATEL